MKHIGFIMDGNRRWAKKLGNIVKFGHENGEKTFEKVLDWCYDEEIPYVSFWALSKENIIERDPQEIQGIYAILRSSLSRLLSQAHEKSLRICCVGDLSLLPDDISSSLDKMMNETAHYSRMTVILAIAYSGQDEIIRAIKKSIHTGKDPETLTEKDFLPFLDTGAFPPPDLIVRTGGVTRHSGFFLYQSAYSEYFFSSKLWPDFSQDDFQECLRYFHATQRNFGK